MLHHLLLPGPSDRENHATHILLACLHADPRAFQATDAAGLSPDHWQAVLELASHHRVRPLVQQRLNAPDIRPHVPKDHFAALTAACRSITLRNLRALRELGDILARLAAADIAVMLLKGAHLAAYVYPSAGLREMGDLDIMVRKADVQRAFDLVCAAGYIPYTATSATATVAIAKHAPTLLKTDSAPVEIHWSLTSPVRRYAISPDELWRRATHTPIGPAPAVSLATEDLLLHLCVHASYQHHFDTGLRPFCDLCAVIRRAGSRIDWSVVQERAVRWQWHAGVGLTLRLATDLLGAKVPPDVSRALTKDIDAAIIDAARVETLLRDAVRPAVGPVVARIASDESLVARATHVRRRVFLNRSEIEALYGDAGFWRRLGVRLWRPWDLLRRHGRTVYLLAIGKRDVAEIATRKNRLRQWLEG